MENQFTADKDENKLQRLTLFRLAVYFIFSWAFAAVCAFSATTVTNAIFDVNSMQELSFGYVLWTLGICLVQFGSGAYVLGSLIGGRLNPWVAMCIYSLPMTALQLVVIWLKGAEAIVTEIQTDSRQLMQFAVLVLNPVFSVFFIMQGQHADYSAPKAVLGIPWKHWLWILPTTLYSAVGVPYPSGNLQCWNPVARQ
jgi:hypothetical protein